METVIFYYILCVTGVFACSCSQILLKKSAIKRHSTIIKSVLNWQVIIAYGIFFCSLVINITAFSHGVNVKDLPILESFGYIFVPILSFVFLREPMKKKEIISMLLIIVGIMVFYM